MALAAALDRYPAEAEADLQRYYGLNIQAMGRDFTALHAAACLSCLPLGSALLARLDPRAQWTVTDYMLHGILTALTGKEIPYPWSKKETGIEGVGAGMPVDEFREWYEKTNWKEVEGCQTLT